MSNEIIPANNGDTILYQQTDNLLQDAVVIIDSAQQAAYRAINQTMIQRNWLLGKRIQVEVLQGQQRADYGQQVINQLASSLTAHYGRGFDASNLYKFLQFHRLFPEILDTLRLKSPHLTWSHYRSLLRVEDPEARNWYATEASASMWGTICTLTPLQASDGKSARKQKAPCPHITN